MSKKYVMFDVSDDRAGAIAEAIGNKTCKKILSLLAEKEMSETDIAKRLGIPANTAHYNVQKLISAGLIENTKSFFWSVKGKKIQTYKLSNKKIIISPKESFKGIIATMVVTGLGAFIIRAFTNSNLSNSVDYVADSSYAGEIATLKSAEMVAPVANDAVINNIGLGAISPWSWFLLGAWAALLIFVFVQIWREHSQEH